VADGDGLAGDSVAAGAVGLATDATPPGAAMAGVDGGGFVAVGGGVAAEIVGAGTGSPLEQTPAGEGGGPPPAPLCGT